MERERALKREKRYMYVCSENLLVSRFFEKLPDCKKPPWSHLIARLIYTRVLPGRREGKKEIRYYSPSTFKDDSLSLSL